MERGHARRTHCGQCGLELDERPLGSGFTRVNRGPCPNCGSTSRTYSLGLIDSLGPVGDDVTIDAPAANAEVAGISPAVAIAQRVSEGLFVRTVVWSQTPDAWLAEIYDRDYNLVAVEVAFDAMDVFIYGHMTPPEAQED